MIVVMIMFHVGDLNVGMLWWQGWFRWWFPSWASVGIPYQPKARYVYDGGFCSPSMDGSRQILPPSLHWACAGSTASDHTVIPQAMESMDFSANSIHLPWHFSLSAGIWVNFGPDPCNLGKSTVLASKSMRLCLLMNGFVCLGDPEHKGVLPFRQGRHRPEWVVPWLGFPNPMSRRYAT